MKTFDLNTDDKYILIYGLCKCGKIRKPVKSDKAGYNKIQCEDGHVKYIHEDY